MKAIEGRQLGRAALPRTLVMMRGMVLVACTAAALAACSSSNGSTGQTPDPHWNGEWSCKFSGQSAPISIGTFLGCNEMQFIALDTPVNEWLGACWFDVNGSVASTGPMFTKSNCEPSNIELSNGTFTLSADGNTLTISVHGDDPDDQTGAPLPDGGMQMLMLTGQCARTGPGDTGGSGCP